MALRNDDGSILDYTPEHGDFDEATELPNDYVVSDSDIASLSQGDGFPMTSYQTKHFVVGDGITPYRMKRQALVEIDSRRATLHGMIKKRRKALANAAILERDIDNENDVLKQEVMRCDLDEINYDLSVWDHKIPQARRELKEMIDHLRSLFPDNPTIEDIKKISQEDEEEERLYWQVRMAKQTAADIIAYGRIGVGQLSSIMMMDKRDQEVVMTKALEFSTKLNNTINLLGEDAHQKFLGSREMPEIDNSTKQLVSSETIDDQI